MQPITDRMIGSIIDGDVPVNDDTLTADDKHELVFKFISAESKQMVSAQIKAVSRNADPLERKHYVSVIAVFTNMPSVFRINKWLSSSKG